MEDLFWSFLVATVSGVVIASAIALAVMRHSPVQRSQVLVRFGCMMFVVIVAGVSFYAVGSASYAVLFAVAPLLLIQMCVATCTNGTIERRAWREWMSTLMSLAAMVAIAQFLSIVAVYFHADLSMTGLVVAGLAVAFSDTFVALTLMVSARSIDTTRVTENPL